MTGWRAAPALAMTGRRVAPALAMTGWPASLDVGAASYPARFDPRLFEEERISAVQYVRFRLGEEGTADVLDASKPVRLRVAHPAYSAEVELAGDSRASLSADLRAE